MCKIISRSQQFHFGGSLQKIAALYCTKLLAETAQSMPQEYKNDKTDLVNVVQIAVCPVVTRGL